MSHNNRRVAKAIVDYFLEHAKPGSTLSPMYQRILGTVAAQVEANKLDWLVEASSERSALETSLLLTSGIHRQVLLGEAKPLQEYYPSVGGSRSYLDHEFDELFLQVLTDNKEKLIPIIRDETIQTNETQRGFFWLFPSMLTGWDKIHLVDLGASAGLNLLADRRRFTWDDGEQTFSFGLASKHQFTTRVTPKLPVACHKDLVIPQIMTRHGCDLNPVSLDNDADRAKLESFVWPDQIHRFSRLHEGVEAHRQLCSEQQQISIQQADLPHDLPSFLKSIEFKDEHHPVVIYNTYMTTYLENEGRDLRRYIVEWAACKNRKVMWVQSEPNEESPVKHHWCAWTVDLWENHGTHRHWQLAWVHPHGVDVECLNGMDEFAAYFQR